MATLSARGFCLLVCHSRSGYLLCFCRAQSQNVRENMPLQYPPVSVCVCVSPVSVYVHVCECVCVCAYMRVCACLCEYVRVYVHMCVCTCVHACACVCGPSARDSASHHESKTAFLARTPASNRLPGKLFFLFFFFPTCLNAGTVDSAEWNREVFFS